MKILYYQPGLWYAVQYNGDKSDICEMTFGQLQSKSFTESFFRKYKYRIGSWYQDNVRKIAEEQGFPDVTPEETGFWADIVRQQAAELEKLINDMLDRAERGEAVDFHSLFEEYEGNELRKYGAFKCYGLKKGKSSIPYPSLIRIYALEVGKAMIMIYGGIKINSPISACPVLKDNVNRRIAAVADYLSEMQVETERELDQLAE